MNKLRYFIVFLVTSLLAYHSPLYANTPLAPVSGFAKSFILGKTISHASIKILETGQKIKTNHKGQFGPILYPVGKPITLQLKKWGYKTTQTATVIVPPTGLTDKHHEMTFQVPSILTYHFLATVIGAKLNKNSCHVAATVLGKGRTMDDAEQGEPGAKVVLKPSRGEIPFYFDIFTGGPLKTKTNPFTKNLVLTSKDGGIAFFNLPPSDNPYTLSAEKNGKKFSEAQFICRKNSFINISPPSGPMVLG